MWSLCSTYEWCANVSSHQDIHFTFCAIIIEMFCEWIVDLSLSVLVSFDFVLVLFCFHAWSWQKLLPLALGCYICSRNYDINISERVSLIERLLGHDIVLSTSAADLWFYESVERFLATCSHIHARTHTRSVNDSVLLPKYVRVGKLGLLVYALLTFLSSSGILTSVSRCDCIIFILLQVFHPQYRWLWTYSNVLLESWNGIVKHDGQ